MIFSEKPVPTFPDHAPAQERPSDLTRSVASGQQRRLVAGGDSPIWPAAARGKSTAAKPLKTQTKSGCAEPSVKATLGPFQFSAYVDIMRQA
jgi:hypothetical protein